MIDTAISKIKRKFWIINNGIIVGKDIKVIPSNDSNKWPANILADSRIARVHGRIKFLVVSIKIIKIIRGPGVFIGRRWINILFVFINHPYNIKVIQSDKDKDRLIDIWLVGVKI